MRSPGVAFATYPSMPWSRMNVFVPFSVLTMGLGRLRQMRGPKVSVFRVTSSPFASRTLKVGVHRQIPGKNPLLINVELAAVELPGWRTMKPTMKSRFCRPLP